MTARDVPPSELVFMASSVRMRVRADVLSTCAQHGVEQ